jgi:hypothetical protein
MPQTIDPSTETLTLREASATAVDELRNKIPSSDPCECECIVSHQSLTVVTAFAFFSWSETSLERRISEFLSITNAYGF